MKKLRTVFYALFVLAVFISGCQTGEPDKADFTDTELPIAVDRSEYVLLECRYYDEKMFRTSLEAAEDYSAVGRILTGVLPHHLLADRMIAGFLKTAAENRPDVETVTIVSTMHYELQTKLCSTLSGWATPLGTAKCDREIAERFRTDLGAIPDNELMQQDHSSSGLVPYVKNYFPDAEISCLLVSASADRNTPQHIADLLAEYAKEKNCLIIFSVDFSHYQTPRETEKRDNETLSAVLGGDISRIARMNDANVDSPYCLSAFILLTEKLGGKIEEIDHSNSLLETGIYSVDDYLYEQMTSYFIFAGIGE